MVITRREFEDYFSGGLTPARREEMFLAILTDSRCLQIASCYLLQEELHSLSAVEEETPGSMIGALVGGIGAFMGGIGTFFSYAAPCGMYPAGLSLRERLQAFRNSVAKANSGKRAQDAALVKRVLDTCCVDGVLVFNATDQEAFCEILRLVEPVISFWSEIFDKGMFSRGAARSFAHELLCKPDMNLFRNYDSEKGCFVTYFESALSNKLSYEIMREIRISFSNRGANAEDSQNEPALQDDGVVVIDDDMLRHDATEIVEQIKAMLSAEEWHFLSSRYMQCKKLKEIAADQACSIARVSRLTSTTMEKVRKVFGGRGYAY